MKINVLELEMGIKSILKINAVLFAGLFSLSANAAIIDLDSSDVYGVYLGNNSDVNDFMSDTGLTGLTELFHTELPQDPKPLPSGTSSVEVSSGSIVKMDYLDYFAVKYDGVFGVYDVAAYAVGDTLQWDISDFYSECMAVGGTNCNAAGSHLDGYGVVPVPAAVWLFASGLLGLIGIARKRA